MKFRENQRLDFGIERHRSSLDLHFLPQPRAHHVTKIRDDGIRDETDSRQAFLAHPDHPCLAQHGKVLGNVRLTRTGRFYQLPNGLLSLHQQVEQAQSHRFGECPEPAGNQLQRDRGKQLVGFVCVFFHHFPNIILPYRYVAI